MRRFGTLLVLTLTSTACSPSTTGGADAADVAAATGCPSALPESGASCPRAELACTYGDDPRIACRTRADCNGSTWQLSSARCPPLTDCDATTTTGAACSTAGAACRRAEGGFCVCNTDAAHPMCDGMLRWNCALPPEDAACPRELPNLGAACESEGTSCGYGRCLGGAVVTCRGGAWEAVEGGAPCPHCG